MRPAIGTRWRASAKAARKPSTTETSEETSATRIELVSASIMRLSEKTAAYHLSDGPLNGGMGTRDSWKENSTRTATGKKIKP